MTVDSAQAIEDLHRQLAPTPAAFELVWTHCQIVARLARDLAEDYRRRVGPSRLAGGHNGGEGVGAAVASGAAMSEPLVSPGSDRFSSPDAHQSVPVDSTTSVPDSLWGAALPDLDRVYLGGLLHDIGCYRVFKPDGQTFDHDRYIFHGLEGYQILLAAGYDESLAQFARNHTGVGISRADVLAQGLPLPPDDYLPRTIEQELVLYADKFHTKSRPPAFVPAPAARRAAARFGQANAARFDTLVARYGTPNLPL